MAKVHKFPWSQFQESSGDVFLHGAILFAGIFLYGPSTILDPVIPLFIAGALLLFRWLEKKRL